MREVAVVGIGLTPVGRFYNKGIEDLFAEALKKLLDSTGVDRIDAMFIGNMTASSLCDQDSLGAYLADYAGFPGVPAIHVEAACGSGGAAFVSAYMAVASGLYDYVVAAGVEKLTENTTSVVTYALAKAAEADYEVFYGVSFAALNALIMREYMRRFNVSREDIALWSVKMHENALNNPHAQFKRRITVEDVLKSPVIADPIRLYDASPISDGAAAVLLMPAEKAKEFTDTLVKVAGIGIATDTIYLARRRDLVTFDATVKAREAAYKMAKIEPKDVDVVEVHDAYSVLGFIDIEDLGFAKKGEAVKLFKEGEFDIGGKVAVNPSGGLKARGHPVGATGIYQIAEIWMQLTNSAGKMQVPNAEVGVAQSIGGVGTTVTVVVLKRVK